MNDQERMTDLLLTEKKMSTNYNLFASECIHPKQKDAFLDALKQGQTIQSDLFSAAQSRGWYQTMPADGTQINQAYQKFSAMS